MALKPINIQPRITEKSVRVSDIDLKKNSVSGDVIDGGTITNFASTGIKDSATKKLLEITDEVTNINNDVFIRGKINCQTLQYNRAQVPVLDVKEALRIDGNEVVWRTKLGKSVKESSLTKVGILDNLEVKDTFYANDNRVGINTTVPNKTFAVKSQGVEIVIGSDDATGYVGTFEPRPFAIGTDDKQRIHISTDGKITLKNSTVVEGKLGVNVKNPQEDLEVAGNIKFQDKTFSSGNAIPTIGTWSKGSIVWNSEPDLDQPIGWVCLKGGSPGHWRPFGTVN
jgi:hypothetical protein